MLNSFVCPHCRAELTAVTRDHYRCLADGLDYFCVDGIWRFLPPARAAHFATFIRQYETVRRAEGWGNGDTAYYRALPDVDLSGRYPEIWRIRAKSFTALQAKVIEPMRAAQQRPLQILDLGAGNGWLSYRLAQQGQAVAAVDLLVNEVDGLGARRYYDVSFTAVQAEFDHLPFAAGQIDVIIFNGSLHYTTDSQETLGRVLPLLRPNGRLVVMDSPIYHDASSGAQMARERADQFEQAYGFRSNDLPHEHYLTFARLARLAQALGFRWRMIRPFYGWRWAVRPWLARLRRQREPASFLLLVAVRDE
jgi:SAM-dependent methyltransferase